MAVITVSDGTPIYYRDQGEGPVLVLLHGLMLSVDGFWTRNLEQLSQSCRVIAIDHRSHGKSGKPAGEHTIAQCARDLHEVLEALDVNNVTLAGVAFGAMVAFDYLRQFGNGRLSRLAIIEAQVRLLNDEGWEHPTFGDFPAEAGQGFLAGCQQSREPLTGFLTGAFAEAPAASEMQRMQHEAWQTPTPAVIDYVADMIAADYRADLPTIDLPCLLVYGRKNNIPIPSELGAWIHRQLADSQLMLFDDSGHSPFYESPDRFNRVLSEFVNG